jgi:hypothetical protein
METWAIIVLHVYEVDFGVIQLIDLPLRSSVTDILCYDVKHLT